MFIEQEFHLWKMTYDLVLNKGFQVLHMNTQAGEVWLEKQYKRKNHVVRMKHKQINWRSEWKRDLEITLTQLNQNKQLFRGAKVVFHSIYISEHPPVDDWEDVSEITSSFKTTTELYYLHDENKREGTAKFYDQLGLTPMEETGDWDADQKEAAIPQLQRQIVAHHERKKQEVQELFGNGKPFVTYLLLAVNVALFLLLEWAGEVQTWKPSLSMERNLILQSWRGMVEARDFHVPSYWSYPLNDEHACALLYRNGSGAYLRIVALYHYLSACRSIRKCCQLYA